MHKLQQHACTVSQYLHFCPHAAVHLCLFLPLPKYPNPLSCLFNEKTLQAWTCIAFMNSLTKAFWNYPKFCCIHFFWPLICSGLIFGPVHAFKSNTIVSSYLHPGCCVYVLQKKHKQANIECSVSSAGLAQCAPADTETPLWRVDLCHCCASG